MIPSKLDKKTLFRLDVDSEVWQDDMGLSGLESEPPRWLADESVRKGISALLDRDRCIEERSRLEMEYKAMRLWIEETSQALRTVINETSGT